MTFYNPLTDKRLKSQIFSFLFYLFYLTEFNIKRETKHQDKSNIAYYNSTGTLVKHVCCILALVTNNLSYRRDFHIPLGLR